MFNKIGKKGDMVMLIYNNLLINKNSNKFQPFLLNLLSGRRRLLNNYEIALIRSMANKEGIISFNEVESELYNKLISENQFLTDERRSFLEDKLTELGYFNPKNKYAEEYSFSIELTRACNMSCSYCYVKSRLNSGPSLTRDHVDAIYNFYHTYADEKNKIADTPNIRITGGEPLINNNTVDLINYIAMKWEKSKLALFTNGVNLLKYYNNLPISRFDEIHVSLDGVKDVHMNRRYSSVKTDNKIYDEIISGVQKLLADGVNVKIKTVLDKTNYLEFNEFKNYLEDNDISNSPNCEHIFGITIDYQNSLDISEELNNINDIRKIQTYIEGINSIPSTIPSYSSLLKVLNRPKNEPYIPKFQRCNGQFLSNYYFSCNGKVYFCDCVNENNGIVGTYYPNISIDETSVSNLLNRSIMRNERCKKCAYKFVCLGGCPISARTKNTEMACGIYGDEDILDNLEYNYYWTQ
jgi:uncharacterized protein